MPKKRILVLANSQKNRQRCVAGREVVESTPGKLKLGEWVRPVSSIGEGELYSGHLSYQGGGQIQVMEVADVQLSGAASKEGQPENWRIDLKPWLKTNVLWKDRALLEEKPESLWIEEGNTTDRVSDAWVKKNNPEQSLYVIRPKNFQLSLYTDLYDGRERRRMRSLFEYKGNSYDLSMTDPVIYARYQNRIPALVAAEKRIVLPCKDDLLLCVSLAGSFHGSHYKLAATVFEDVP